MQIRKQKINLVDVYQLAMSDVLASPEYFASQDDLKALSIFTASQIKAIEEEQIRLTFAYIHLYAAQLIKEGRIGNYGQYSADELRQEASLCFGNAVVTIMHVDNFKQLAHVSSDSDSWIKGMDDYNVYVIQNHKNGDDEQDFFLAFEHFKKVVMGDRQVTEDTSYWLVTYAKNIRENIIQPLIRKILKNYRFTSP